MFRLAGVGRIRQRHKFRLFFSINSRTQCLALDVVDFGCEQLVTQSSTLKRATVLSTARIFQMVEKV